MRLARASRSRETTGLWSRRALARPSSPSRPIWIPARYLADETAAVACIAGYAISNDVSEREFQLERGGQWDKGKNCETFNPARTVAGMIFGVHYLVWYLSQFMVLRPGDVINTGTPAGVALGLAGQPYLCDGDVVELEIDGLGRQRQTMGQA
jgi:2-keto-4-pentenoate hydratase/2-oxohepta-3-ene-1,7-dioic acid hydratase in catechol pathway